MNVSVVEIKQNTWYIGENHTNISSLLLYR